MLAVEDFALENLLEKVHRVDSDLDVEDFGYDFEVCLGQAARYLLETGEGRVVSEVFELVGVRSELHEGFGQLLSEGYLFFRRLIQVVHTQLLDTGEVGRGEIETTGNCSHQRILSLRNLF